MSQETLIFLHISKTGGTTLRSIIQRQYPKHLIYDLDPSYHVSDPNKYEENIKERVAALRAMPDNEKQKLRCVIQSVAFGIHELLPQSTNYVTMLRNPIDHYISDFYFAYNRPSHPRHQELIDKGVTIETAHEYFDVDNFQTRRISGYDPVDLLYSVENPLPKEALEMAKKNLSQNIAVFGLMEYFDESLLLMQARFGWKNIAYRAKNVAKKRTDLDELSPQVRSTLEALLADDLSLYEYAQKLFKERMEAASIDWDNALTRLRKQNQRVARWHRVKKSLRSIRGNLLGYIRDTKR